MRRFCSPLVLVAVLLAAGCGASDAPAPAPSGRSEPTDTAASAPPAARPPASAPSLSRLVEAAKTGPDAVLDLLPAPRRRSGEAVENRHVPGQMDTLRTYTFDGLTMETHDVAHAASAFVRSLTTTNARYRTDDGLHVGSSRAEVEAALGPPSRREGDTAVYEIGEPTPDVLRIAYDGDVVRRLRWSFYVD